MTARPSDDLMVRAGFGCRDCGTFGPGKLDYEARRGEYTCRACGAVYEAAVWERNVREFRRLAGLPRGREQLHAAGSPPQGERRDDMTKQAHAVPAAPALTAPLDRKLQILQAFGTKDVWERIQGLLGTLAGLEEEDGRAKWALHQADEDLRSYELLLTGLAEGKNAEERRASVEKAKAGDERWQAARAKLDEARTAALAASVVLSSAQREYAALGRFLDLRAAQLHFLAG